MSKVIGVNLTDEQLGQFERASKAAGCRTVAAWLRDLGAQAIAPPKPAVPHSTQAAFEEKLGLPPEMRTTKLRTAAEIAASIPGLSVGLGTSWPTSENGGVTHIGDAPMVDLDTRPWLPELVKLQRRGEFEDVTEDFTALHGGSFRPPKGWAQWSIERRASWLDANHPLEVK